MGSLAKKLYKLKRFGNSLFTYSCVSCGKAAGGSCLCEKCIEKSVPSGDYKNKTASAFYYEGPPRDVILRYKFGSDYELCSDILCDWLMLGYEKLGEKDFDAAVSVPSFGMKTTRLSELAEKFCLMEDIDFKPEYLRKIRETKKQHDLSVSERRVNLIGAFEAEKDVFGKKILLIDDILTTGSTAAECSNALYDKGAEEVFVLTVLRTKYTA